MRFALAALFAASAWAQTQTDWVSQIKNKPVFDVRSYGAKCDGSHDDTTAFQSAITAAQSVSGAVLVCSGTAKISHLNITSAHVSFVGHGKNVSVLSGIAGTTGCLLAVNPVSLSTGIHATDFTVDLSAATSMQGVCISNMKTGSIERVSINRGSVGLWVGYLTGGGQITQLSRFADIDVTDTDSTATVSPCTTGTGGVAYCINGDYAAENWYDNDTSLITLGGTMSNSLLITRLLAADYGAHYFSRFRSNATAGSGTIIHAVTLTSTQPYSFFGFWCENSCVLDASTQEALVVNNAGSVHYSGGWIYAGSSAAVLLSGSTSAVEILGNTQVSAIGGVSLKFASPATSISAVRFNGNYCDANQETSVFSLPGGSSPSDFSYGDNITGGLLIVQAGGETSLAASTNVIVDHSAMRINTHPSGGITNAFDVYDLIHGISKPIRNASGVLQILKSDNSAVQYTFDDSGDFGVTGNLQAPTGLVQPGTFTAGSIFSCGAGLAGAIARVSDSSVNAWGGTLAGGGSFKVLVACNGTDWTVIGK